MHSLHIPQALLIRFWRGSLCFIIKTNFHWYDLNTIILRRDTKAKEITDFYAFIASSPMWQQIICAQYESFFKGAIFSKTKVEGGWFKHVIPSRLCPRVDLGSRYVNINVSLRSVQTLQTCRTSAFSEGLHALGCSPKANKRRQEPCYFYSTHFTRHPLPHAVWWVMVQIMSAGQRQG